MRRCEVCKRDECMCANRWAWWYTSYYTSISGSATMSECKNWQNFTSLCACGRKEHTSFFARFSHLVFVVGCCHYGFFLLLLLSDSNKYTLGTLTSLYLYAFFSLLRLNQQITKINAILRFPFSAINNNLSQLWKNSYTKNLDLSATLYEIEIYLLFTEKPKNQK